MALLDVHVARHQARPSPLNAHLTHQPGNCKRMTPFRHVLLTRFNLATPGREAAIRNDPDWLRDRFHLFETYCLATVAAQTNQNFDWIVYFDEATPDEFRKRIETCRSVREFNAYFTPLFGADGWKRSVLELVADDPRSALLTTTLDNDDGLAIDFIERLQIEARRYLNQAPLAFNFQNGFTFKGGALYKHRHSSNAFRCVLEPYGNDLKTAPSFLHIEMARHFKLVQIAGAGGWLQVIHDRNVSNRVRGRRVRRDTAASRFPDTILQLVREPDTPDLLLHNLILDPFGRAFDRYLSATRMVKRLLGIPLT
jgi:hypothetical protein